MHMHMQQMADGRWASVAHDCTRTMYLLYSTLPALTGHFYTVEDFIQGKEKAKIV